MDSEMKLLPMETAPKDGTHILLYGELDDDCGAIMDGQSATAPIMAFFEGYHGGKCEVWYHVANNIAYPIGWMPLPEVNNSKPDETPCEDDRIEAFFLGTCGNGTSIFNRQVIEHFVYNGQFRKRNTGEKAFITVDKHENISSVQFEYRTLDEIKNEAHKSDENPGGTTGPSL